MMRNVIVIMKKNIAFIVLMVISHASIAQNLTTPQVSGIQTGTSMTVSLPFDITGVPFSQISGSVWYPNASIVAELCISYYVEGDATKYGNKKTYTATLGDGTWKLTSLKIEPQPYPILNKKLVEGRLFTACLFISSIISNALTLGMPK
jgi:hypothetical protein